MKDTLQELRVQINSDLASELEASHRQPNSDTRTFALRHPFTDEELDLLLTQPPVLIDSLWWRIDRWRRTGPRGERIVVTFKKVRPKLEDLRSRV